MTAEIIDEMNELQVRDFAKQLIDSLELAQNEGIFGTESWHGFLQIEVEVD